MKLTSLLCLLLLFSQFSTAQSLKQNINALLKDAPNPESGGIMKKIPAKLADIKLGYYGVFAVMKFQDSQKLGIFNIAHAKFQKIITLKSNNFLFACGGDLLLVYFPDFKVAELWNLTTFKKLSAKKIQLENGIITNIEMGAAVKTKAFVSGGIGDDRSGRRFYGLMDLRNFRINMFPVQNRAFRNSSYRDYIHIRPNNALDKIVSWCTSHSPSGFNYTVLGNEPVTKYVHNSYGALNLTNNDEIVVTTSGHLTNGSGQVLKNYQKSMLFPVLGGNYYIEVANNGNESVIKVRDLLSHIVIHKNKSPIPFSNRYYDRSSRDMTGDKVLLASKLSKSILLIDRANLFAYTLDLGVDPKAGEGLPPLASAGKDWKFQLPFPAGTSLKLEDAPKGMVLKDGVLEWPSPSGKGFYEVLISHIKPGEEEDYSEYKVWVK